MIPLEAEDATIPANIIEIPRVTIGDNSVIVKEKGGHHAHETGNPHAKEEIPSIID